MTPVIVLCENPAEDIFVDLHAECVRDLRGNMMIAEPGVAALHLEEGRDDFLCRNLPTVLASDFRGGEQAPRNSIDQRLVES